MVSFGRNFKKIKKFKEVDDSEPISLLCSGCMKPCTGPDAHVIPWWNDFAENFFTTYRCGNCWLSSLDETRLKVNVLDEDARTKFCDFLSRHKRTALSARIRTASLHEASALIIEFLKDLRAEREVLHP